jgi:hypothetical protein
MTLGDRTRDRGRQFVLPVAALTAEVGNSRIQQRQGIADP